MATRKAIVLVDGRRKELPDGDDLANTVNLTGDQTAIAGSKTWGGAQTFLDGVQVYRATGNAVAGIVADAGTAGLNLDASGQAAMNWSTTGSLRWQFLRSSSDTDFKLIAFDDDGVTDTTVFTVDRATGALDFNVPPTGLSTPTGTGFRHVTVGVEDGAAVTIDGQSTLASGDVQVIAPATHAATSKTTPVDADELALVDSAASNGLKKLTWANLKATLKAYFDTIYVTTAGAASWTLVKKTSNETRTSTTTVADDATLKFSAAAGATYRVKVRVQYSVANGTMDFKFVLAYPAAFSEICTLRRHAAPVTSIGAANESTSTYVGIINVPVAPTGSVAGIGYVEYDVTFTATAAGTFSFQWAQNTSDAGNLTVLAGSYLEYASF